MAALLRQGARRIGGSVLQRTQAALTSPAVAEERRRLVTRRLTTAPAQERPSAQEVQQMKEKLYEALSKVENYRNRRLLQHLAVHVNPRSRDTQWSRLRASKWATNVVRVVANLSFATALVIYSDALVKSYLAEKREIPLKNREKEKREIPLKNREKEKRAQAPLVLVIEKREIAQPQME